MIKISIITVVLNNKKYIEDCIQGVLEQTYQNIEYIVVDGGSTDGTLDIIKKYDDKITKWISEPDRGIYDAMNKGISMATGDVVGILNADDVYYDCNVLGSVADIMRNANIDACYSDLVYVGQHDLGAVIRYWRSCPFKPGLFREGWVPPHPTFFARKRIYEQYGNFDLDYTLAADYELLARLLERHRITSVYVPKIFVKMRLGGATNKSIANILKQNIEILRACKKNKIKILLAVFLMHKLISRLNQFQRKPAS